MNSFVLKLFAVIFMMIDHIGILFFPKVLGFRIIGRIAFPIFAFLIVEGFIYTSNIKRYILRLTLFGIISEIPFNLLVSGEMFCAEYQNVFFTFVIGLVMLCFLKNNVVIMYNNIIIIMAVLMAVLLKTDYSLYGIALIYLFYMFRDSYLKYVFFALVSLLCDGVQRMAVLAIGLLLLYNGKPGPEFTRKKIVKYGFYIFYPLHMLMLLGIRRIIYG